MLLFVLSGGYKLKESSCRSGAAFQVVIGTVTTLVVEVVFVIRGQPFFTNHFAEY